MSGIPGDPPPFEPFPVTSSERLHDSPWCGLRRDQIDLGGGRAQDYHVFEVSEAVCVVPIATDGSLVAVWQYRHPLGATHWEVPAGRVDEGESPVVAAERELLEETGVTVRAGEPVYAFDAIERDSADRVEFHYAVVDLLATYVSGGPRAMDDAADARWLAAAELDLANTSDVTVKLLKKLAFIGECPARY